MHSVSPHAPGLGFLVDPHGISASCRSDVFLQKTIDTLNERHALDVLDYPGTTGRAPMLVAYGAGDAEWGILIREHVGRDADGARPPVATLCALLARLADQRDFAGTVFAEVALALRAAHAPGHARGPAWRIPGGLAPWQSERALAWMEERLDTGFTSADVAALVGMSAGHFTRAFRVTQGISPRQWILRRRVERAQVLLAVPGASLSDVALSCGFSEQSHFTRVFTRMVGAPPGAWRRRQARTHVDTI